jgi:drug/metabolite transporter (DMT)-like permease
MREGVGLRLAREDGAFPVDYELVIGQPPAPDSSMDASSSTRNTATPWRAIGALFVVTLIWGGTFVWMKQGMDAVERALGPGHATTGIALFMVLRFGVASVCTAAFIPASRRELTGDAWRGGMWIGALLFVGFALQMFGLAEISPAVSAFLTSLYVLFTAVLTAGIERRGPSLALFLGVVLATCGAGFVRGRPELSFNRGEIVTVGCAVLFALHILATDRITKRVSPMAVTLTSFVWVSVASLVLFGVSMMRTGAPGADALLRLVTSAGFAVPLLLSSVLATFVALSLMNHFQRELDPVRAAILYAFEPIWAALFGIASGTDSFTVYLWSGGALLLAGNLVAEIGQRRKLREAAPG